MTVVRLFLGLVLLGSGYAGQALDCQELFRTGTRTVIIPASGCDLHDSLTIRQAGLEIQGANPEATIRLLTPAAGLRIENAPNVRIRSLAIASSVQNGSAANSVFVIGVSPGFSLSDVDFSGGGPHVSLNGARDFFLQRTRHRGLRTSGFVIYCYECHRGIIDSVQIDGYDVPAGGPFRAIEVLQSEAIQVIDPAIRDIDASSQPNFAGVEFVDSLNSSVTGGRISGLINGDGITVGRSRETTIANVIIANNSGHPREIPGGGTGSGIDVFGAADTTIVGCIVRRNGHSPAAKSRHYGLELYEAEGVLVVDTAVEESGVNGVVVYGSHDVKLVSVAVSRNRESGVKAFAASGKAVVVGKAISVSAPQSFGKQWRRGSPIRLRNTRHRIRAVSDNFHLLLEQDAGSGQAVPWRVESSLTVIGGRFDENGIAQHGNGYRDGLTITDRTQALLVGVDARAADKASAPTQLYGARTYPDAEVLRIDGDVSRPIAPVPHLQ